jgi:putative toxin-antitoxin system antitoxin component (TIGR02293 family)
MEPLRISSIAFADLLGDHNVPRKIIESRMDLIELGDKGVTKDALVHLARYLDISLGQMAELLSITERTIQRYTMEKSFNRILSEQILQIAEVAARGTEVFGDKDKFLLWLKQPNRALGNKTPINLLGSRFGAEMILDELGRMEYGVFS